MNALAALFGVTPADRAARVATMLASAKGNRAGYWLQLLLAMAIATLGLALGSAAVVIGAMLVSPLMTPILALGMGLAIGSPLLVIRSGLRVIASVAIVVTSAALLTLMLPMHEVTAEIASRTSPTALDLAIASCCAIAGVYAVVRSGSDTASAAAGTAIGIALVPPLCVVGYGLGTRTIAISSGAALLFTANGCAILFFSVLGFVLLGYGTVPVAALEREHSEASSAQTGRLTARFARRLSSFFASRLGPLVRIGMPLILVLAVYWPLRSALAEVTWEIRVRAAARDALRSLVEPSVYSSVRIERRQVSIRLVTVGTEADAVRLRTALTERIKAAAGSDPIVEVVAVPDAKALARAEAALRDQPRAAPPTVPTHADLALVRRDLQGALAAWPADIAGPLLGWRMSFAPATGAGTIEVVHLGRPLGPAAESLLARSLSGALHEELRVRDVVFDPEPMTAARTDGVAWLSRAADAVSRMRALAEITNLFACVDTPTGRDVERVANDVRKSAVFQDPRVVFATGEKWALRWSMTTCAPATDAGTGAGDAGDADASP